MNLTLWILQVLLALHTVMGAVWKFSNSEAMASLKAIPHPIWQSLPYLELLCAIGLVIPAISKKLGILTPISALIIMAEMLLYCAVQFTAGEVSNGQIIYWLVVAAFCGFVAYGRFVLKPF